MYGDWLIAGKSFSDMGRLCREIKEQGFEPAIWVAPFIVEKDSILFKNNSEWLIHDELGSHFPQIDFPSVVGGKDPGICSMELTRTRGSISLKYFKLCVKSGDVSILNWTQICGEHFRAAIDLMKMQLK